jgi:hypothetical protein
MTMRSIIDLIENAMLDEAGAGPARITQHVRDGRPFLMLSAMRANLPMSQNKKRTDLLKRKLTGLPVSFIVTGGEFHELGQEEPSEEVSFLIMPAPGIDLDALKKFGVDLMNAFEQDAIVFGDGESVNIIEQDGTTFQIGDAASFDPAVVRKSEGFSKIKGRSFTFTNKEETPAAAGYGSAKNAGENSKAA